MEPLLHTTVLGVLAGLASVTAVLLSAGLIAVLRARRRSLGFPDAATFARVGTAFAPESVAACSTRKAR